MPANLDIGSAVEFLSKVYGPSTADPIFLCSLPNSKGDERQVGERAVATRDPADVASFAQRWDRDGRGTFLCVGTLVVGARAASPKGSIRHKGSLSEVTLFHADVDAKSIAITLDAALKLILDLPCPPSVVVRSGHGLHLYWLLKEGIVLGEATDRQAEIDKVEGINALLGDLVGGDPVMDACRLMRLPGSRNTKDGDDIAVTIERADYDLRYEVADIEDMLDVMSPRVPRKPAERRPGMAPAVVASNPFLAVAARFGIKPPLDVEDRLRRMAYGAPGENAIHATQVSVTASLLSSGRPIDEVVDLVLDATMAAAGEFGTRWRWDRERSAIRRMCEDWLRKKPEIAERRVVNGAPVDTENVVQMGDQRSNKGRLADASRGRETPKHIVLGLGVIESIRKRGDDILVTEGEIWHYTNGLWSSPTYVGKQWLEVEIEIGCRALSYDSTNRLIGEARNWIIRNPDINHGIIAWDAHGKIPTRSGLVDFRTGTVMPPNPEHRATWRIECDYDPTAQCTWWRDAVSRLFSDRSPAMRDQTVALLQEVLGVSLIENRPKALSKALVLQGGANSGKTTVLDVFSGLISDSPITTTLEATGGTHGLMDFARRAPWVLHEAFDQSRWLFSSMVKSLLTGDPVPINVKNGPMLTKRFTSPVFWGTNHPPQFKEATKAIVNRMVVINCRQEFDEGAPVGAAVEARARGYGEVSQLVLADEKAGLLNWAIEGLIRALDRGHLALTSEVTETRAEIRSESNLVDGFVRECATFTADGMIHSVDFCAAFTVWWHENKGENRNSPSNDQIGKALSALGDGRIGHERTNKDRVYLGLHLNEVGQDYWKAVEASTLAQGKASRLSAGLASVNKSIPATWDAKEHVVRIRAAFVKREEKPPDKDESGNLAGDTSRDTSGDTSQIVTLASVTDTVASDDRDTSEGVVSPRVSPTNTLF